jgi:hypothetical protein
MKKKSSFTELASRDSSEDFSFLEMTKTGIINLCDLRAFIIRNHKVCHFDEGEIALVFPESLMIFIVEFLV